jgi:hypothetical protein
MGNYVAYRVQSREIRDRLKYIDNYIGSRDKLKNLIEREQRDGYWNKKGAMGGDEFSYIEALKKMEPEIPALEKEKVELEEELKKIRKEYL